jgi:hypothetical protein
VGLLAFAGLAGFAVLAGGHAGISQMLLHGRQDGASHRLLAPGWRTELVLLTEQFSFVLKKIRFGDDRFLPAPPTSPLLPNLPLAPPHDVPPSQAAHPAERLQTLS